MKKARLMTITVIAMLFVNALKVAAFDAPYRGYTYDFYGRSMPAPTIYSPERMIFGEDLKISPLNSGEDLFVYKNEIYILDSGNNRIVVIDSNYKLKGIIKDFYDEYKKPSPLKNPKGLYIRDDYMFIADTGNARVIKADMQGNILLSLGIPDSELIPKNLIYKPIKCVSDRAGYIYVLSEGVYQGLINYNKNGEFIGFYGSNKVQVDFTMFTIQFWKRIFSSGQAESIARILPIEYSNIYILGDFIYATTRQTSNSVDEIRKLNSLGVNILRYSDRAASYPPNNFGDVEGMYDSGYRVDNVFVDVHVDSDEIISMLDQQWGRVFLYDQDCNLLGVFGAVGEQKGTTRMASAIEKLGDDYMILDKEKNCILVYKPTQYMQLMREGIKYYSMGLYDEAIEPWNKVLIYNSSCTIAYKSIGKSLLQKNEYKKAMDYFKIAQSRDDYSRAQKEYRKELVRKYFIHIVIGAILFLILLSKLIDLILKFIGVKKQKKKIIFQ